MKKFLTVEVPCKLWECMILGLLCYGFGWGLCVASRQEPRTASFPKEVASDTHYTASALKGIAQDVEEIKRTVQPRKGMLPAIGGE